MSESEEGGERTGQRTGEGGDRVRIKLRSIVSRNEQEGLKDAGRMKERIFVLRSTVGKLCQSEGRHSTKKGETR
jgi:hypothetical protein